MVEDYESLYISRYLNEKLSLWESAEVANSQSIIEEATTIRKVLDDYISEGYAEYVKAALKPGNAGVRLDALLRNAPCSEDGPLAMDGGQLGLLFMAGASWELPDYLKNLSQLDELPEIERHFPDDDAAKRWKEQTERVLKEMAAYLDWVLTALDQTDSQPVMLLRDALLIHLGLQWKGKHSPKALIFNRAFTNAYGEFEEIYEILIYEALYKSLVESDALLSVAELRRRYRKEALAGVLPKEFVVDTRRQLDALNLERKPMFVESGVNGTFPLWLLSHFGDDGGMLLYNTVPWLYEIYDRIAFRGYEFLRDVETVVSHNWLFQLDLDGPKAVPSRIRQTTDARTLDLAHYEIVTFRRMVET